MFIKYAIKYYENRKLFNRQFLFLCIFVFHTISCMYSQFPDIYFNHLNNIDGLSNNRVNCIIQDSRGYLWIGTLDGLNKYDGYSFHVYKSNPDNNSEVSIKINRIGKLFEDSKGFIWMGASKKGGIQSLNPYTGVFHYYPFFKENEVNVEYGELYGFKEVDGVVYANVSGDTYEIDALRDTIVPSDKLNIFASDTLITHYQQLLSTKFGREFEVYCHLKEKDGTTWLGTRDGGLFIVKNEECFQYTYPPFDTSFEIRTLFQDKYGVIWIGTRNNGLYKHYPPTRAFKHFNYFKAGKELMYDITVRAITEDSIGNIWVGTYNDGIVKFNMDTGNYKHIYLGDSKSSKENKIRSLLTNKDGSVWAGSYSGITIFKDKKRYKFGIETEKERKDTPYMSSKLHYPRVYGMQCDAYNNVWIASWNALSCYNMNTKLFKHYPASFFGVKNIRKVYIDSSNIVWIASELGGLVQFNPANECFEKYFVGKSENSLVCDNVFDIHEYNKDSIWVSTFNGLDLLERKTGKFHHFFTTDGLCSNMIYGIMEDRKHDFWFTTSNGISKYERRTKTFINYDVKSGLLTNEFAEGGFYKSKRRREFIVGGINGFQIFNPDSIKVNMQQPDIVVNNVRILNENIEPGKRFKLSNPNVEDTSFNSELVLNPDEKIVTFNFAALHYAIPENNHCRYKLEGFDKDWLYANNNLQRSATYTNLWPGDYKFHIQAANCDNVWNSSEYILRLKILPPFWLTWWAYVIYLIAIFSLLLLFRNYTLKKAALKNALDLEKMKLEEERQIGKAKMNLFTNISHEFRTPLSLIIAPIDKIMRTNMNVPIKDFYKQFQIISNNSRKLLELTNQVLDLRKIEAKKQELRLSKINIIDFVEKIVNQFDNDAIKNGLKIDFEYEKEQIDTVLDAQMLERIVNNLLSNALKFTNSLSGNITVRIYTKNIFSDNYYSFCVGENFSGDFFEFSVQDDGIGIKPDVIHKIFDSFYRVENDKTFGIYGSGVGLTLLKELVLLHKGLILVKSEEEKGSTFTIRMPLRQKGTLSSEEEEVLPVYSIKPIMSNDINESCKIIEGRKNILIVDDNHDILSYLMGIFNSIYNVYFVDNAKDATIQAFKNNIDLIISDIAMPGMSGIEMSKRLKNDPRTCFIPIILLTARTQEDMKIKSFEALADEYIEKPFNSLLLVERVKNLIQTREKIKESFIDGSLMDDQAPIISFNKQEDSFLKELDAFLEENISDQSLSVESLCHSLGVSRSSLHNKIKTISGMSASEYIRSKRIHKAKELMRDNDFSVLEIAYQSGFSSPSYFIKCFKNKYGVTPKEYMHQE